MKSERATVAAHRVLAFVAGVLVCAGLAVVAPASAQAAYSSSAPSGVARVSSSTTAIALRWNPRSGAPRYRIQYSTSSRMTSPRYLGSTTSYVEASGLRTGRTYWFRVRVISATGSALSPYSSAIGISTASSGGYAHLAPTGLAATSVASSSVALKWSSRAAGLGYRIAYAVSGSGRWKAYNVPAGKVSSTVLDLAQRTGYVLRIRAIDATTGASASDYSPTIKVVTPELVAPVRVATYNVRCANCLDSAIPNEKPWAERRDTVVAYIRAQDPDVIGVQEASQGWLKNPDGSWVSPSISQFEDLRDRLGAPYELTNDKRNACVNDISPTDCVPADNGASRMTRILYKTTVLDLVDSGSKGLTPDTSKTVPDRYVAWAVLRHKATGKKFFFANVHLPPPPKDLRNDLRKLNTTETMDEIARQNTARLPVVLVGDFNSTKFASPTNAPYDVVISRGLLDPLGNRHRTTTTAPGAFVEKRIHTSRNSFNNFTKPVDKASSGWLNGSNIDYIFTSRMRVTSYETYANLDSSGSFVGTIPSDHNLLRADVRIP